MLNETSKMMKKIIDEVVEKFTTTEGRIRPYRDYGEDEISLEDNLYNELSKTEIPFAVTTTEAFESCGYDCSTVVASWYVKELNTVDMIDILTETY